MREVTFTISGKPFAKQRPRMTRQGRAFTPKETVSFERAVGQIAAPMFPVPLQGPLKLIIWATFAPAQSWSKKKTAAYLGRHHTQRPDLDNVAKAIKDGLNRIAYADDCQVAEMTCRKIWGPVAQTVVTIKELEFHE